MTYQHTIKCECPVHNYRYEGSNSKKFPLKIKKWIATSSGDHPELLLWISFGELILTLQTNLSSGNPSVLCLIKGPGQANTIRMCVSPVSSRPQNFFCNVTLIVKILCPLLAVKPVPLPKFFSSFTRKQRTV